MPGSTAGAKETILLYSRLVRTVCALQVVLLSTLLASETPAATAATLPTDPPDPAALRALTRPGLADVETDAMTELVARVNAARELAGRPPLELADALNASAHVRAAELQGSPTLSHERPVGSLQALLADEGVDCSVAGETLARVVAPNPSVAAAKAYDLLIDSETHRDVLLYPGFAYLEVAISESGGRWLVVQVMTN